MKSFVFLCAVLMALSCATSRKLSENPADTQPLGVGDELPAAMLQTSDDREFPMPEAVIGQPTLILFYRGGWCPYCNRHLADVQTVERELRALGFQILAISPDPPKLLRETAAQQALSYKLVSDANMQAANAFGLAFAIDDATVKKYKEYKIELTATHNGRFWLPVPAAYLVDAKGRIIYAHTDPDYKKRVSGQELLAAARKAVGN